MTRKTNTTPMLRGSASHRRTQSDYLRMLLDRVTLETWGEVIDATVARAKEGDAQARAWLASYLMGRATTEAPAPLAVMVQAIGGDDPLVTELADNVARRLCYGGSGLEAARDEAAQRIAEELPDHVHDEP